VSHDAGPVADPLADLRAALEQGDPSAFAGHFAAGGWIRVPRPSGDLVLQGPDEIARAGHELRTLLGGLSWTPSQRFLSAGQVVEQADVQAWLTGEPESDEIRVSMRVVIAFDPSGGIGSLTLWIDWAALNDPLGVASPLGAASALVAHARAQDGRGLQVFQPPTDSLPVITTPVAAPARPAPNRSVRPPAGVLWWRQHRGTLAGAVMAVLAVVVLGWVAQTVLRSPTGADLLAAQTGSETSVATGSASAGSGSAGSGAGGSGSVGSGSAGQATGAPSAVARVPVITQEQPSAQPTVQAGPQYKFRSDLLFRTNSTDLSGTARELLKAVATQARGVTGTIQINGYTDNVGTDQHNRKLSRDRATAVAEALQEYLTGSTGSQVRLAPQGFGETHPFRSNATAAGRSQNRRVVVVLPKQ
jgi:outer membrane protein OmpA-like peptidoglycan-associated protein